MRYALLKRHNNVLTGHWAELSAYVYHNMTCCRAMPAASCSFIWVQRARFCSGPDGLQRKKGFVQANLIRVQVHMIRVQEVQVRSV